MIWKNRSCRDSVRSGLRKGLDWLLLLAAVAPLAACVGYLFALSGASSFERVAAWFDPVFFQYNLALLLAAVLVVPAVTFFYSCRMKENKRRRLQREVPEEVWEAHRRPDGGGNAIDAQIDRRIRFASYFGSVFLCTVVIALGACAILLLKPLPLTSGAQPGLDYGRGANVLMLGPFLEQFPGPVFQHRLIVSLCAFQFGFLGAYVYFVGQLARGYFTLDLTPDTLVDGAVRMITASLVSLVLSFPLFGSPGGEAAAPADLADSWLPMLPVVCFFFGFYPARALTVLEKLVARFKWAPQISSQSTPLSKLPGMSYAHELRLQREGFENVENLSHAKPLDLALRTAFSYPQLDQWIDQAWLCAHLRDDYEAFVGRTGVTSRGELRGVLAQLGGDPDLAARDILTEAGDPTPVPPNLSNKVSAVCRFLA